MPGFTEGDVGHAVLDWLAELSYAAIQGCASRLINWEPSEAISAKAGERADESS